MGNSQDAGVAKLLESVLNQVLQAQVSEQVEADRYERTENRKAYRNGSYPHGLHTRSGNHYTKCSAHPWREVHGKGSLVVTREVNKALILAMMEMVVNGVSTRKSPKVTEELCGTEFSKSTVSDLCKRLDPIVTAWNNRSLADSLFRCSRRCDVSQGP
ncbi:transposase [Paenibacillus larvae]|uniref:transposase n=1 Tax=Paenibacillus larvae TaxID=1464 RepID=UPI00288DD98E|nr:transposase [Paenibacillus larvae]MDT2193733.1 transposase [Paenibacillus larvae]